MRASWANWCSSYKAERDENTCRKALNPVEAVRQTDSIRRLFEEEAKRRHTDAGTRGKEAGRGQKKNPSGNLPEGNSRERAKRESRTKAAEAAGLKPRTFAKAEAVVRRAEENPQQYGPVAEQMAKTGSGLSLKMGADRSIERPAPFLC